MQKQITKWSFIIFRRKVPISYQGLQGASRGPNSLSNVLISTLPFSFFSHCQLLFHFSNEQHSSWILYMKRVFRICSGLNLEILFSKKSSLILLSYERMIILSVIFATITTAKSNDLWLAPNFFPCYMTVASCSSLSLLISRSRLLEQSQCIKRHSLEIYNASNKLLLRHGTHDILLIPVDQTMSHRQVHRHWIEMYTLPVKSKQQGNGKWHWILSLGTEEKTLRLII